MKKTFIPPPSVAAAAKKGLALRNKFKRGGTAVGWARGRQLAARRPVSEEVVKRMYSYFCRHQVDKRGKNYGNEANPSKGYIAWLLWGGDAGARWAESLRMPRVCTRGHHYRGTGPCPVCWPGGVGKKR